MRATPAQIAVRLICGEEVPPQLRDRTLLERVREGHESMVRISGQDFGYDLQAWHDYLKVSRDGGYTYGRNIALPRLMQKALASAEWRDVVKQLSVRE